MLNKLIQRIKCLFGRHDFTYHLNVTVVRIFCQRCGKLVIRIELPVVKWVEVRNLGYDLEAFTRTFLDPSDVPRVQRIPGSGCFPLIRGTQVGFEPYKGMSPLDTAVAENESKRLKS